MFVRILKKRGTLLAVGAALLWIGAAPLSAGASRSTYPVVFAHGLGALDNFLGFFYFGDDYGAFVGRACDELLRLSCNADLDPGQQAYAARVTPFQSSEARGVELADEIESVLATTGASAVNLVGHSQGGLDARKAAYVLKARHGRPMVRILFTVSAPHRGSPMAPAILRLGAPADVLNFLVSLFGPSVREPGNDGFAALLQWSHEDPTPDDGVQTGARVFNERYPNRSDVAGRYVSAATAEDSGALHPALLLARALHDIEGEDDGLVGISSQQSGWRLRYNDCYYCLNSFSTASDLGQIMDVNRATPEQISSTRDVVQQDHVDVVGVGPDLFDEKEFYAAAIHYIANYD